MIHASRDRDVRIQYIRVMARLVRFFVCASFAVGIVTPAAALAQTSTPAPQTRAETLKRARDDKQKTIVPYEPNGLERALDTVETRGLGFLARDGVYAKFGSLATGSGFAYGAGYRNRRLIDREGALNLWAAGSLKRYWAVQGSFDLTSLAGGFLTLGTYARHNDYPQESFFGIGPDSSRDDHTAFKIVNTMAGGRVGVKPTRSMTIAGGVEYFRHTLGRGDNPALPSIEARFSDATAAGIDGHSELRSAQSIFRVPTIGNPGTPAKAAGTAWRPAGMPTPPTRSRSIAWMWISASTEASWQNVACWRCGWLHRPPNLHRERACRSI